MLAVDPQRAGVLEGIMPVFVVRGTRLDDVRLTRRLRLGICSPTHDRPSGRWMALPLS
jgi:hypothetical protein